MYKTRIVIGHKFKILLSLYKLLFNELRFIYLLGNVKDVNTLQLICKENITHCISCRY